MFSVRTTKFRHLKGTILGRETHITNFSGLSKTIPGECDGFKANSKFGAVPIGPSCNQLAVLNLSKGMRLSGGVIPHLVCGHVIADFAFDPFNDHRIAIGCDNGTIQFWTIPDEGLNDNLDKFDSKLVAHNDRLTIIQFHPNANDVLASFAMDLVLIIWDLKLLEAKISISAHSEPLFGMSWSPDGVLLATLCKDQKIRVFDPRDDRKLIQEGSGPPGSRGGRICWAQKGKLLIVSGFSRFYNILSLI
jgi:coronin-7